MLDFIRENEDVYSFLKRSGRPIAIYGMGNGADKLFSIFDDKGISVKAVFASDDFVRGQVFHGYRVKTYGEVCAELGDFIVVPAFATRIPKVMKNIDRIDDERVLRFPELPVIGCEPMDLGFIEKNAEDIERAYDLLEDDFSKEVYSALINFRISGKLHYLRDIMTDRREIMDVLGVKPGEVYADLGAYDGDTLEEFSELTGGFSHAVAVEPDRRNFRKLQSYAQDRDDITLVNKAVFSEHAFLEFNDKAGRNSAIEQGGRATVEADSPDKIFADAGVHVSYVKMDVEGAERAALLGMRRTIDEYAPKLCVCAYHRACDLWTLPIFIKELRGDYKVYLRKHLYYPGWETAVYCTL